MLAHAFLKRAATSAGSGLFYAYLMSRRQIFPPMAGSWWLCAGGRLCLKFLIIFGPSPFFCPYIRIPPRCFQVLVCGMKRIRVSARPSAENLRGNMSCYYSIPNPDLTLLCLFPTLINKSKCGEEWLNSQKRFSFSKGGYGFIHPDNNLKILQIKFNATAPMWSCFDMRHV